MALSEFNNCSLCLGLLEKVPRKLQRALNLFPVRLKCLDFNDELIVMGAELTSLVIFEGTLQPGIGMLFIYTRRLGKVTRMKTTDQVTSVKLFTNDYQCIAAGEGNGYLELFQLPSSCIGRNRRLVQYAVKLHDSAVTAITWSADGKRVVTGDAKGLVVLTSVDFDRNEYNSSFVCTENSVVSQLAILGDIVAISTQYRAVLCFLDEGNHLQQIGTAPRKGNGNYGVQFCPRSLRPEEDVTELLGTNYFMDGEDRQKIPRDKAVLFTTRPGCRLWRANGDGHVLETLIYKEFLLDAPVLTAESPLSSAPVARPAPSEGNVISNKNSENKHNNNNNNNNKSSSSNSAEDIISKYKKNNIKMDNNKDIGRLATTDEIAPASSRAQLHDASEIGKRAMAGVKTGYFQPGEMEFGRILFIGSTDYIVSYGEKELYILDPRNHKILTRVIFDLPITGMAVASKLIRHGSGVISEEGEILVLCQDCTIWRVASNMNAELLSPAAAAAQRPAPLTDRPLFSGSNNLSGAKSFLFERVKQAKDNIYKKNLRRGGGMASRDSSVGRMSSYLKRRGFSTSSENLGGAISTTQSVMSDLSGVSNETQRSVTSIAFFGNYDSFAQEDADAEGSKGGNAAGEPQSDGITLLGSKENGAGEGTLAGRNENHNGNLNGTQPSDALLRAQALLSSNKKGSYVGDPSKSLAGDLRLLDKQPKSRMLLIDRMGDVDNYNKVQQHHQPKPLSELNEAQANPPVDVVVYRKQKKTRNILSPVEKKVLQSRVNTMAVLGDEQKENQIKIVAQNEKLEKLKNKPAANLHNPTLDATQSSEASTPTVASREFLESFLESQVLRHVSVENKTDADAIDIDKSVDEHSIPHTEQSVTLAFDGRQGNSNFEDASRIIETSALPLTSNRNIVVLDDIKRSDTAKSTEPETELTHKYETSVAPKCPLSNKRDVFKTISTNTITTLDRTDLNSTGDRSWKSGNNYASSIVDISKPFDDEYSGKLCELVMKFGEKFAKFLTPPRALERSESFSILLSDVNPRSNISRLHGVSCRRAMSLGTDLVRPFPKLRGESPGLGSNAVDFKSTKSSTSCDNTYIGTTSRMMTGIAANAIDHEALSLQESISAFRADSRRFNKVLSEMKPAWRIAQSDASGILILPVLGPSGDRKLSSKQDIQRDHRPRIQMRTGNKSSAIVKVSASRSYSDDTAYKLTKDSKEMVGNSQPDLNGDVVSGRSKDFGHNMSLFKGDNVRVPEASTHENNIYESRVVLKNDENFEDSSAILKQIPSHIHDTDTAKPNPVRQLAGNIPSLYNESTLESSPAVSESDPSRPSHTVTSTRYNPASYQSQALNFKPTLPPYGPSVSTNRTLKSEVKQSPVLPILRHNATRNYSTSGKISDHRASEDQADEIDYTAHKEAQPLTTLSTRQKVNPYGASKLYGRNYGSDTILATGSSNRCPRSGSAPASRPDATGIEDCSLGYTSVATPSSSSRDQSRDEERSRRVSFQSAQSSSNSPTSQHTQSPRIVPPSAPHRHGAKKKLDSVAERAMITEDSSNTNNSSSPVSSTSHAVNTTCTSDLSRSSSVIVPYTQYRQPREEPDYKTLLKKGIEATVARYQASRMSKRLSDKAFFTQNSHTESQMSIDEQGIHKSDQLVLSAGDQQQMPKETGLDIWCRHQAEYPITSISSCRNYVAFADSKRYLWYSSLKGPDLKWTFVAEPADTIAISPNGKIVWRLLAGTAYALVKPHSRKPRGKKWIHAGHEYISVSLTNHVAWCVKSNGEVIIQSELSWERPTSAPRPIDTPMRLVQISAGTESVWGLTDEGAFLVRIGINEDQPFGLDWVEVFPECVSGRLVHLNIFSNVCWAVDTSSRLWFTEGLSSQWPIGRSGKWWQVMIPTISQNAAKFLIGLVSPYQCLPPCVFASGAGLWLAVGSKLYYTRSSLTGNRWKHPFPQELSTVSQFSELCASALYDPYTDYLWIVRSACEIFGYQPKTKSLQSIIPCSPAKVASIAAGVGVLWVVDVNGKVFIRTGIDITRTPLGTDWATLNTSQFDSGLKLIQLSCSVDMVFAADNEGGLWARIGTSPTQTGNLTPAWIPLDVPDVTDPPSGVWTNVDGSVIWMSSKSGRVFSRFGITSDFPIGSKWVEIPGLICNNLCVGYSSVWAVTGEMVIFRRINVSATNPSGDYWKQMPGEAKWLSVTPNQQLWGLDADGRVVQHTSKLYFTPVGSNSSPEQDDWEVL